MKAPTLSIVLSLFLCAAYVMCIRTMGVSHPLYTRLTCMLFTSGSLFSILIPITFFFIRRWDGCIEKLGGLTFAGALWLASVAPLLLISPMLQGHVKEISCTFMMHHTVHIVLITLISTHLLRTSNYTPPKPGERLTW